MPIVIAFNSDRSVIEADRSQPIGNPKKMVIPAW